MIYLEVGVRYDVASKGGGLLLFEGCGGNLALHYRFTLVFHFKLGGPWSVVPVVIWATMVLASCGAMVAFPELTPFCCILIPGDGEPVALPISATALR